MCFIDLSKAYDSANRPLAWKILRCRGAPGKIVDLVQVLHQGTTCAMPDSIKAESWFAEATGSKQRDVTSLHGASVNAPLLYNFYK